MIQVTGYVGVFINKYVTELHGCYEFDYCDSVDDFIDALFEAFANANADADADADAGADAGPWAVVPAGDTRIIGWRNIHSFSPDPDLTIGVYAINNTNHFRVFTIQDENGPLSKEGYEQIRTRIRFALAGK